MDLVVAGFQFESRRCWLSPNFTARRDAPLEPLGGEPDMPGPLVLASLLLKYPRIERESVACVISFPR